MTDVEPNTSKPRRHWSLRLVAIAAGIVCVGLGVVGLVIPLMPSTIFFILAAACFARASPRLEAWVLQHRLFGAPVRAWRERRAIPRAAKLLASAGMASGLAILVIAHASATVLATAGVLLGACAFFIWTQPD